MKSIEDMSVKELEREIKFVESKLDTNPCAPDYLRVLKNAYAQTGFYWELEKSERMKEQ